MRVIAITAIGFCIDVIVGDPHYLWHPVQGIGCMISRFEKLFRHIFPDTKYGKRLAGVLEVIFVLAVSGAVPFCILWGAGAIHPVLKTVMEIVMCYQILALKSLKKESVKVYYALKDRDIDRARTAVSYIVGRDTKSLTEEGIVKATVETVAENTSDGIIAPLFYLMIGGPVLGFIYKAVNTMDSMIGYKNDKYLDFGRAAARLDDAVNYIPARIAALFMIAATFFTNAHTKKAAEVYRRDKRKHSSPNAAQTEAVMAGALGIALAGDAWYFGVLHKKEVIGDSERPVVYEDIKKANKLLYITSFTALVIFGIIRLFIYI